MKKYGFYWQNNGGIEFEAMNDFVTEKIIDYNNTGEGKVSALYIPFNPRSWNKNNSASTTMSNKYPNNVENLKKLNDSGIYPFTTAIVGTPEQSRGAFLDELNKDKELIKNGYLGAAIALSATMLPGTGWYDSNGHNIINKKDYTGYSLFTTHHRTDFLEAREIEECMIKWLKELDSVQKTYYWQSAFPNS
jgi:hypothetical protein